MRERFLPKQFFQSVGLILFNVISLNCLAADCPGQFGKFPHLFDNRIRLGESDPAQLEKFRENIDYSGAVPIPANVIFNPKVSDITGGGVEHRIKFESGSIREQRQDIQTLFNGLKDKALTSRPGREVEFAAIVIDYPNGTSKAVHLTSSLQNHIRGQDFGAALRGADVLSKPALRVTFVHTHPYMQGDHAIVPSVPDYRLLRNLELDFQWTNEPNVVGIVLPTTPANADIFFHYLSNGLQPAE